MSRAKPKFHSLTQARHFRDERVEWALKDIKATNLEAILEGLCRGDDYRRKIDMLKTWAQEDWEHGGCNGVPGWAWLDELGDAVEYIWNAEHAAAKSS